MHTGDILLLLVVGGLAEPFKQVFIFSHDGVGLCVCVCLCVNEYRIGHRLEGKLLPWELSEGIMSAVRLAGNCY